MPIFSEVFCYDKNKGGFTFLGTAIPFLKMKHSIKTHDSVPERDHVNPDAPEKFPPEISRTDEFSFSPDSGNPRKYLRRGNRALDVRLCISDEKQPAVPNPADPMHDKQAVCPLKKYHIPDGQRRIRFSEINGIPAIGQKRRHRMSGNDQTDFVSLFSQLPKRGNIGGGVHNFHGQRFRFLSGHPEDRMTGPDGRSKNGKIWKNHIL